MSAFSGKTLMITGGTGSFGNTVLKHWSYVKKMDKLNREYYQCLSLAQFFSYSFGDS